MKEATGEANMTVVTIILIAAVVAIATPLVNSMMTNTARKSCCTNAGGTLDGNLCVNPSTNATINDGWDAATKKCN